MKHTRIVVFLLFGLLVTAVSAAAQSAPPPTENAQAQVNVPRIPSTRWSGDRIDPPTVGDPNNRGMYASIAFVGSTPYISYYDATNKDLRLAYYVGTSGNCGSSNTWWCYLVDSSGDVGKYSSIAVDSSGSTPHVGIAYYNATNFTLKYADYSCFSSPCSVSTFTIATGFLASVGEYASLKFDSSGVAHIAYQIRSALSGVGYAHSVSSGGDCGLGAAAGKWQCDTIEIAGANDGKYTSLDLNSSNQPRIAYYDGDNLDLKYAVYLGTGTGTCNPDNNWWCGRVDSAGDVGRFASMQVDRTTNNAHIAYYDATNGKLKYAKWIGASGNCGDQFLGQTVWRCDTIDDMGSPLTQAGISLALDANGYPNIVYMDASDAQAPAALRIARPEGAVGQLIGNCGPSGGLFLTWQCDTLDGGGSYLNEADYAGIAFNSAGLATVAYYETDDYYPTGYLKVIKQSLQLYLPLTAK